MYQLNIYPETFTYKIDNMHNFYPLDKDKNYKKTKAYLAAKSDEHIGQVMSLSENSWICTEEEPLLKKVNKLLEDKIFLYYQKCIKTYLQDKNIPYTTYLCENGRSYYFQFSYCEKVISVRVSNHDEGRNHTDKSKKRFHHIHFRVDNTDCNWSKAHIKKKVYRDMDGCLNKQHCKLMNRLYTAITM